MKKIAILQSNYIPWKGYFDIIGLVDEFILYDDMQYTRRDWRNRNKIKTPQGLQWLTIPVDTKGKYLQKINETRVVDHEWAFKHLKAIRLNYSHAPYYEKYEPVLADLYEKASSLDYLSEINYLFLTGICRLLGIRTKITWSSDYTLVPGKTERLAGLVLSAGGDYYLSGPAAKDYIVDEVFEDAGIELAYMDYEGYPEYPQLHGDYVSTVSIIDLLMMTGPDAPSYMKCFRS
ncbi:MAG: WbqC family protein [Lachnospiraceae bacterium]|nr:WbqC family protein [Lachnospiraceae bacterium]